MEGRLASRSVWVTMLILFSFLLVEFQLNHILKERDPRDVIEKLDFLPKDLSSAYEDILFRIEQNNSTEVVRRILSWLLFAKRPLIMNELREVISIRLGDRQIYRKYLIRPDVLIECYENLVEIQESSEIVRFTHYTVQEFLRSSTFSLLSQVDLSRSCLTYLNFEFPDLPLENAFFCWTKGALGYAMIYWGKHTKGEGEDDSQVIALLGTHLNSPGQLHLLRRLWGLLTPTEPRRAVYPYCSATLPLQTIAGHGLSRICSKLLEGINVFDGILKVGDKIGSHDFTLDMEALDYGGRTALHVAAVAGQHEVVETLLQHGVDIHQFCGRGFTALDYATNELTTEVLLKYVTDSSIADRSRESEWHQDAILYYIVDNFEMDRKLKTEE
jgi:Ankyrin repeats (many copies)